MLSFTVEETYYNAVADGTKSIEGRLAKKKYSMLNEGDRVCFVKQEGGGFLVKTVVAIYYYPTFEQAFREQDFKRAIPQAVTLQDALAVYERFYPKPVQREHGVVFIEVI